MLNNGNSGNQGFASMPDDKQREIASEGGRAAQRSGHAHKLTPEERSKGGKASSSQQDMSELGRKGAEERWDK